MVLLGAGPCATVLTGRLRPTSAAGLWAVALSVLCGVPDGIFGTGQHLLLIGSIVAVAAVAVMAVVSIDHDEHDGLPSRRR